MEHTNENWRECAQNNSSNPKLWAVAMRSSTFLDQTRATAWTIKVTTQDHHIDGSGWTLGVPNDQNL